MFYGDGILMQWNLSLRSNPLYSSKYILICHSTFHKALRATYPEEMLAQFL